MTDFHTALLAAIVVLCIGIWATLVGFEYIGKPAGADLNPAYAHRQRLYKIGGPIVIVLAIILAAHSFWSRTP